MTRLLLDTCAFVWVASEPDLLGASVREAIDNRETEVWLSDASVWEICLKWKSGKLRLPAPPRQWVEEQASIWKLSRVAITREHLFRTTELPELHRDPYDRLLVAQAIIHGLVIATPDPTIRRYPVATVW